MKVRYRVGKSELIGKNKEMDMMDIEDQGFEYLELRWIKDRKISMAQQICGFQDVSVMRNREGDAVDFIPINDSPVYFRPGENKVGWGYMLKTDRNMHLLAGILKNELCKAADPRDAKELEEIVKKLNYKRKIDLRDTTLDGVLSVQKSQDQKTLLKNESLKERIRIAKANLENEALEKELYALEHPDEVIEDPTPVLEDTVKSPEPTPSEFADGEFVISEEMMKEVEIEEATTEEVKEESKTEKTKRKINTSKIKRN